MIQVIAGKKGSGKTKRLIDLTNATARDAVHDVIFLDDDNRYMYDVDHNVRFINAADYDVRSTEMFLGLSAVSSVRIMTSEPSLSTRS